MLGLEEAWSLSAGATTLHKKLKGVYGNVHHSIPKPIPSPFMVGFLESGEEPSMQSETNG